MEARVRERLPSDGDWAYEPKWDGFRALAWSAPDIRLDSRKQRPLLRYLPELTGAVEALPPGTVVDGEVVVVVDGQLNFDALQQRIHPAESRIARLAAETPAGLVAFDLLAWRGEDLRHAPFQERRQRLVELAGDLPRPWHLTPSTTELDRAQDWFDRFESAGCDGIVAKRATDRYQPATRAMVKVKHRRHVNTVIGGYRLHKEGDRVGSLLLGLYDGDELAFVGHCASLSDDDRIALLETLHPLEADEGFGQAVRRPGEPSRWTGDKDLSWVPLRPELVAEVSYDQLTGHRFRHAARLERWRADVDPSACTFDQLATPAGPAFDEVVAAAER